MAKPKESSFLTLNVKIEQGPSPDENELKNEINTVLPNYNNGAKISVINLEDTFLEGEPDKDGFYYIKITLNNPILFSQHKKEISKKIRKYLENRYGNTTNNQINNNNITPRIEKIKAYVDDIKATKQIFYPYSFELDESISKFISCIQNNDVKNGNKHLSKILREKIDNRLNKSLKK